MERYITMRPIGVMFLFVCLGCGGASSPGSDAHSADADPLQVDAHAMVDARGDAGVPPDSAAAPDAVGFAPWHSWDGLYSLSWVKTSDTCSLSTSAETWNYVTLTGVNDGTPPMDGVAWYQHDADPTCCAWPPARVTSPGHAQIDALNFGAGDGVSACLATQTSAMTFDCEITRYRGSDPSGPCQATFTVTATVH